MRNKAHKWEDVLIRFEKGPPDFKPMADLVRRISLSPYRDNVFPAKSMFSLLVFQTEEWDWMCEMLRIEYSIKDGKFYFEFFEHPNIKTSWKKNCPTEEGYSAFIHFLKLKNWFPVAEVERGA
jgi:hypothetical protein